MRPETPQSRPERPLRRPETLRQDSQGLPEDPPEELWDLVSLPEYSQELFEELWTRLMTSKARSHTYRQPRPSLPPPGEGG